ncbi:MAG: hydantoinase/oxoprolinase family protein [Desulfobacterales bacterium]|nr:hydantoinase/oxoprolinase family protein [Desulfobacterales bacterium]
MKLVTGVDIGGTFTDCVILDEQGNYHIGKVLSTADDFSAGMLGSIDEARQRAGAPAGDSYEGIKLVCHGCTVTTNALLNENGARVGLLITRGFEDTLVIGRVLDRTVGLRESELMNYQKASKPAPIVPRTLTRGICERMDRYGKIISPLDMEDVRLQVEELVSRGVDAVAVCLLWSFLNPSHEKMIKDFIQKKYPQLYVVISSELLPVIKEYERANTTAVNCFIGKVLEAYLGKAQASLVTRGYKGELLVMQSNGGLSPSATVRKTPVTTVNSGPVGGIVASQVIGELMDSSNIITTDMGGTSFDVGLIVNGLPVVSSTLVIGRRMLMVPCVEITTIGAGGGSIAQVDEMGLLTVGPMSAGADPGPACYGRGGQNATVTDADLVLGYLDPEDFLGGRMKLDLNRAREAIDTRIAGKMGTSVEEAAAGILEVINAHMADLVRQVTVERGYNPKDFSLFAFGGAGPCHCVAYGADLMVSKIVVPPMQTVFSAFGVNQSNIKHSYSFANPMTIGSDTSNIEPDTLNSIFTTLQKQASHQLALDGIQDGIALYNSLDMRYKGQAQELTILLPWSGGLTRENLGELHNYFEREYSRLYTSAAILKDAQVEIITFRVEATAPPLLKMPLKKRLLAGSDPTRALMGQRPVYWPKNKAYSPTKVYKGENLQPGNTIAGPALIQFYGSTIVLEAAYNLRVDEYLNCILTAASRGWAPTK